MRWVTSHLGCYAAVNRGEQRTGIRTVVRAGTAYGGRNGSFYLAGISWQRWAGADGFEHVQSLSWGQIKTLLGSDLPGIQKNK
jgi:hypothetical protein